jgi:hypothetical protein
MNKIILFEKHQNQIRSRAHHYSRKYNLEYEELEAQGYLIFCEAVERFDDTKAGFSTFLHHRLRTLNDFCLKQKGYISDNIDDHYNIAAPEVDRDVFYQAVENLSEPAQELVSMILDNQFVIPGRKYGKIKLIKTLRNNGWERSVAERAVEEVEKIYKKAA